MALIYKGTVEEKKKFLFEMYDLDGDGVVTREELLTMLSHIPAAFRILDFSMLSMGGAGEGDVGGVVGSGLAIFSQTI